MVPLSSLVKVSPTFGPEMVVRYNGYTRPTSTAVRRRVFVGTG